MLILDYIEGEMNQYSSDQYLMIHKNIKWAFEISMISKMIPFHPLNNPNLFPKSENFK